MNYTHTHDHVRMVNELNKLLSPIHIYWIFVRLPNKNYVLTNEPNTERMLPVSAEYFVAAYGFAVLN